MTRAPVLLVVWTVLTWTVRIRNVLTAHQGAGSLVVPVLLTVLAVAALVDRRRGGLALAAVTIAVWLVRVPLVLVHHHPLDFKVVHLVLALISWALAGLTLRVLTARRQSPARLGS